MKNTILKSALPAVALVLAGLSSAYAVPSLTISDGAGDIVSTTILADASLFSIGNGSISTTPPGQPSGIAVGDWSVNILTGLSFPILGSASSPTLDLGGQDSYVAGSGGAGPGGNVLTITFTADGYSGVNGTSTASIGGVQGNGTLTFTTQANGNPLTASGVVPSGPFSNATQGSLVNFSGPLTEIVTLTANGNEFVSFDANMQTVPDSGTTLMLLGSSLTVLGLVARSRKAIA